MIKPECLPWSKIAWFSVSCKTPTSASLESTRKTPASPWLFPLFFSFLFSLFLSSTASHYRLYYYSTQQVWHLWPPGLPSWLPASTSSSPVSGRGPPICLGCCQLLVMRRHPPNVIKSLKKYLKVPGSWKGVYNMLLLLLFFKNVGTLCVKMTIKKIEKTWWNHNARPRKS